MGSQNGISLSFFPFFPGKNHKYADESPETDWGDVLSYSMVSEFLGAAGEFLSAAGEFLSAVGEFLSAVVSFECGG